MKPYVPDALPLSNLDYERLLPLVGRANAELARYDGLLQGIPNASVMLSPLTIQEAVLSSRIEGTQATADEVLEQEAGIIKEGKKYTDIQQIINYRHALRQAHNHLREYPIRLSLVRELHRILMYKVRGQEKNPGEFRTDQNWIGPEGCSIEEATFVPPQALLLPQFLEEWEKYLDSDDIDFLLQTAVMHAQFELLHPFRDGNGRIGRILIPLFMFQKRIISQTMFYMSAYLELHRPEYYARLGKISESGDWNGWISFFLEAVASQSKKNAKKVSEIQFLYDSMKEEIRRITHSQYTIQLLDAIFDAPIFSSSQIIQKSGIPKQTAMGLIRQLKEADILMELRPWSGRRPAVLSFPRLLNITEGHDVL